MKELFSFYKCRSGCNAKFAIEAESVEEPICPACGSYYFSYIANIEVEVGEVSEGDQCA